MRLVHIACVLFATLLLAAGCYPRVSRAPAGTEPETAKSDDAKPAEAGQQGAVAQAANEQPAAGGQDDEGGPKPKVEYDTGMELLDKAIAAHGGMDMLMNHTSWKTQSKGTYMGKPYQATTYLTANAVRMDISAEEPMVMVHTDSGCWSQSGASVTTCSEPELHNSRIMMAMHKAALLWPLAHPYQNMGWRIQSLGKKALGNGEYEALQVEYPAYNVSGTLYFSADNHLLSYMSYPAQMKDKEGEFLIEMKDYKPFCGIQVPTNSVTQFNNKPYYTETVTDLTCEPFDDTLFAPPASKPTEPAAKVQVHEVTKGETLGTIAKKYGVHWKALVKANKGKNLNKLNVGDRIVIPQAAK